MNFIKNWLASFDHNEDTGYDYKKLTAFWFAIVATVLIMSYSVESVDVYFVGIKLIFRKELVEFKWILGIVFVFILILIYFTNSKDLTKFILKFKNKEKDV
jgi:hypothetical protein